MPEESEPFDTLCEVYRQLTAGPVLTLSVGQRATLREVMQDSREHTTHDVVGGVLAALDGSEGDIALTADLASLLRREIEGSIRHVLQQRNLLESRALIALPEYKTRMSDLQLCGLVHAQLRKGTYFSLPEKEIMQFVDILNQTATAEPAEKRLYNIGECIRHLRKDTTMKTVEPFFRIELGDELAEFLRTNLADAIRHGAGLGSNG